MSRRINAEIRFIAKELVYAMETCHICLGVVLVDDNPIHCEDCSGYCDDHKLPNCRSIALLHGKLKRALKG